MLRRDYDTQVCSIARTLEVIGERWTILIIRDAFNGIRRFEDFQRSLGIARNVLSARLQRLVNEGILEKRLYEERPRRYEYRLTEKGKDLFPVLMALVRFGDRHRAPDGPPYRYFHRGCGGEATTRVCCDRCGADVGPRDLSKEPGPGLSERRAA